MMKEKLKQELQEALLKVSVTKAEYSIGLISEQKMNRRVMQIQNRIKKITEALSMSL